MENKNEKALKSAKTTHRKLYESFPPGRGEEGRGEVFHMAQQMRPSIYEFHVRLSVGGVLSDKKTHPGTCLTIVPTSPDELRAEVVAWSLAKGKLVGAGRTWDRVFRRVI